MRRDSNGRRCIPILDSITVNYCDTDYLTSLTGLQPCSVPVIVRSTVLSYSLQLLVDYRLHITGFIELFMFQNTHSYSLLYSVYLRLCSYSARPFADFHRSASKQV